jgi:hypothetical protein
LAACFAAHDVRLGPDLTPLQLGDEEEGQGGDDQQPQQSDAAAPKSMLVLLYFKDDEGTLLENMSTFNTCNRQ